MKLCLGTVQFGTRYGIQNADQPSLDDCMKMLDYALHNGVDYLDTAAAYGTAELVVGELFRRRVVRREEVCICSKLSLDISSGLSVSEIRHLIEHQLKTSLERLGTDYLDACLFHQAKLAFHPAAQEALATFREGGLVRRCGVSVYAPEEAQACLESEWVDMMQVPASIFDQRMLKEGVLDTAVRRSNFDIHSRSAFVQGLIMMRSENVPETLAQGAAREAVRRLDELCLSHGISKMKLAIQYVKHLHSISHLVFGVDNLTQLREYIKAFHEEWSSDILEDIAQEFRELEPKVYMPSQWKSE